MKKLYNSLFLSIIIVVTCISLTQAQITVLKSTTSLCRDISMPVYYTAYGCDGQVQWLNYLREPIGTSNVSSDVPGFKGSNTYYVKCGTSSPEVFYIDKTKTVRSTTPSIGASSTTINNRENVTLTASGCGGTVSWMSGNYVLSNSSTLVATPTTTTSYYALCTESDKCVSDASTQTITVTVNNPSLAAPVINTQNLGALSAGISTTLGAFNCFYTVQWYKNGSSIGSGSSISVIPAACDTYTATCVNGSVVSPASNALIAPATNPTITNQPQASTVCAGRTAILSVVATGAISYQWRRNGTNISGETNASLSVSNVTAANAGPYDVLVNSKCGSITSQAASFTISTGPSLSFSTNNVSCFEAANGSATVTPTSKSPYSYSWTNGGTSATINNLIPNTYTVTVTDGDGCTKSGSVSITKPTALGLSTSNTAVSCKNGNTGSVTANPSGGTSPYSYAWSNGATTQTVNNLTAGTYNVTITDANRCTKTGSATVTEPTELMLTSSSVPVKCKGESNGSASVVASGGTAPYTYSWSGIEVPSIPTLSNVSVGNYTVTVTDGNGCTRSTTITVVEAATLLTITGTPTTAVKCNGGNDGVASVNVTGGAGSYSYTWTTKASTQTISNLSAGEYGISVLDAYGCVRNANVIITQSTLLMLSTSSVAVKCKNGNNGSATINVNGGISPYTYLWNTGATTTSISNLVAGTYNVTVKDANNCAKSITIVVIEPTELMISTSSIAVKCKNGKDGSVTVVPIGGTAPYTYRWSNSATTQTATGLIAGMYIVTVTDVNNCAKNSSITVTEPTALTYQFTNEEVKCNAGSDGKITVIAQGGTSPYKFIYNGTASTDLTVVTLRAGDYLINVQDNNNCLATEQKTTLTQPSALEVNITEELMPRGFQTKDGRLVAKIVGGTAKQNSLYTTAWLFEGITTVLDKQTVIAGGTGSTIDKIQGGNYALTVTDDNFALSKTNEGCKKVFTYFVKQPDKIVSVATVDKSVSCFGKSDGKLTTTVKGGVTFKTGATYLYKWFKQDQAGWINLNLSTTTIQYVDAGQYMVKIEDANGITDSVQVNLKVTPSINSKVVSQINPSCSTSKDGLIEVQAIGAIEPITVTWSKALTGTKVTNLAQGNYFGIIKDNAGCFGEVTVTLTAKENISAELISKNELVCADKCEAVLELAVKGGISPYTVQWSNGATGLKNSQLCAGTYSATVKTTNGCSVSVDNIKLDTPQAFKIEVSNDVDICSGSTLEINAASQVAQGVSYEWTYPNGTKSTNPIVSIKTAGAYKIEVVNANGCSASDDFKVNMVNIVTGINFTVTSQGQVGESIYAINLSPTSLATTWNVIGSADILQNDKSILKIKPTTEGTLKVELTATVGTCKANLVKSIIISKASTVVKKSIPKVELESIDDLFLVYPNPNEGHFAIKVDPSIEGEVQIKIYNGSLSEVLYTETFDTATKSQVEVTIPEVLNKLLFVVIQSQNKKTVKRVLVRQ